MPKSVPVVSAKRAFKLILCLSTAILSLSTSANARVDEDGTVRYDQAYFANYKAVTLEDMLKNIPGGTAIVSGLRQSRYGGNRGFGSSGAQVLINGKRMAGKANDMAKNLTRIQASQVDYVELIRGNAEGLDIRNEGVLINVVLKSGADNKSSTFIQTKLDYTKGFNPTPSGQIAHNGKQGNVTYGMSYQLSRWRRVKDAFEDVLNPDLTIDQYRPFTSYKDRFGHTVTGNIGIDMGDMGVFRLNGLFEDSQYDEDIREDFFNVDDAGARTFFAYEDTVFDFKGDKLEIGGDYEKSFGKIGNLKALFVINKGNNLNSQIQDHIENGDTSNNYDSSSDSTQKEQIFRASMTTQITEGQSLEYGGEGAFNTLDKAQLFETAADDIALVKEDRYEVFATHNFTISDVISLQSSVTGEFSKVFQDREGVTNTRKYNFLKPRFELRYDITGSDQIRFSSDRKVSQLNLNNFVASLNIADDSINFGNPNLVPEKTWTYAVSYEKRLANDGGSFEAKLSYEDITDHIDRIQIGEPGDVTSGVGNIGDAKRWRFDFKGNARLGFMGLPTAVLSMTYRYMDPKTTDPFTLLERPMSSWNPHYLAFDFEHNIPEWDFKYGFDIHRRTPSFRQDIYLHEKRTFKVHMTWYAEYTYNNIKGRLNLGRILNSDQKGFYKTVYDGHIADNIVDRIEDRQDKVHPNFYFSLQTTF